MALIRRQVIDGKFGPQVVHNGNFYQVGSFSKDRVEVGKTYDFILEEKEYGGKIIRWANLPKKIADGPEDESVPAAEGSLEEMPPEPKPAKKKAQIPAPKASAARQDALPTKRQPTKTTVEEAFVKELAHAASEFFRTMTEFLKGLKK